MPPFVCQQIITSMRTILGQLAPGDGSKRLADIHSNSLYFRRRLRELGFAVLGDEGSPVIPMLIVHPAKLSLFSEECAKRGVAVVVVGYPATPIILSRARFCISAAHTKADLDYALDVINHVGELLNLKLCK